MRRIIYTLLISLLFSSCPHRIVRYGYAIRKRDYQVCDVEIYRNISISDSIATKVGEIKLGDTGFSMTCSEEQAINILKGEACAINADLIIITEEKRPNVGSTCYRCRAEFYRLDSPDMQQISFYTNAYNDENIRKRVSNDMAKNTAMIISAVTAGVVGGFIAALIY